jgi:hypothetical protein
VFQFAARLTVPLTVAVHRLKKPFIYAGFDNLNTDGHGWTRIQTIAATQRFTRRVSKKLLSKSVFIRVHPWLITASANFNCGI